MRLPRLFRDRAAELLAEHERAELDRLRMAWPCFSFSVDDGSFTADAGSVLLSAGSPAVLADMLNSYQRCELKPDGFMPPGP